MSQQHIPRAKVTINLVTIITGIIRLIRLYRAKRLRRRLKWERVRRMPGHRDIWAR